MPNTPTDEPLADVATPQTLTSMLTNWKSLLGGGTIVTLAPVLVFWESMGLPAPVWAHEVDASHIAMRAEVQSELSLIREEIETVNESLGGTIEDYLNAIDLRGRMSSIEKALSSMDEDSEAREGLEDTLESMERELAELEHRNE